MNLFAYGTLQSAILMHAVIGRSDIQSDRVERPGYIIAAASGDSVPCISKHPKGILSGVLWQNLSVADFERLKLYGGAIGFEMRDIDIRLNSDVIVAKCFFGRELQDTASREWQLSEWESVHLIPALLAVEELFSHDPLPSVPDLRRMWPMIEARAWAKHRAASPEPSTVRYTAQPGDITFEQAKSPYGAFFRMQGFQISHRTFEGGRSAELPREVFFGIDAALVLPFDPVRGRVLLVEQMRMGPACRRDPNPWMLEPVAGIVDARETPEEAARREAMEEANLSISHLEPAGRYYCSPGSSTDYFYNFVGLCDLAEEGSYLGGLPDESEDLRLHVLSFEKALELADLGEISAGPLLYLLHWLARHRDRLSAMA